MAQNDWIGGSGNWTFSTNWSLGVLPTAADDVTIASGSPQVSSDVGTVATVAITTMGLDIYNGGALTTTGDLTNSGTVSVDYFDYYGSAVGGSSLSVGGVLSNSGTISLVGGSTIYGTAGVQALLDISGAVGFGTEGVVTGTVELFGNSAINFASGTITSIADHASLYLDGADAVVSTGGSGTNDALTGLTTIGSGARFTLLQGASVATSDDLDNSGTVSVGYGTSAGGASLSVGGVLTNRGSVYLESSLKAAGLANTGSIYVFSLPRSNGSASNQLDISGAAGFGTAGVVTGSVELFGNSAIDFDSGGITSLAAGSRLQFNGADAVVSIGGSGTNDALLGLTTIGAGAGLVLQSGASVATSGDLANSGYIGVDISVNWHHDYIYSRGSNLTGGSSLSVGGVLSNSGTVGFGHYNGVEGTTITAAGLANTGTIKLYGGSTDYGGAGNQAVLDIAGAARNDGVISAYGNAVIAAGSYEQESGARLDLWINGTNTGQNGTIAATGGITLDGGTLYVFSDSYVAAGQSFTLATFASGELVGIFDALGSPYTGGVGDGTTLDYGNGLTLGLHYNDQAGNIELEVVATPVDTADSWTATTGTWSAAANWSSGVPTFYSDVTIGDLTQAEATLDQDASIDSLVIADAADSLTTNAGTFLAVGSTIDIGVDAELTVGGKAFAAGDVENDGVVTINGSILGIRGTVSGSGFFGIGASATLELADGAAGVIFDGNHATLRLTDALGFGGTFVALDAGDAIDYTDQVITSAEVDGTVLTVIDSLANSFEYDLVAFQSGAGFRIEDNGEGGSRIVVTDLAAPFITSITQTPPSGELGVGDTVTFTVTTSEAVTGVGGTGPSLSLNDGGVATFVPTGLPSHTFQFVYTVQPGENIASLAVTAVNLNGASAEDSDGNPLDLSLAGLLQDGPEIDTTVPFVASITQTPPSGVLGAGETVSITLTASEPVLGSGGTGPTLTLNDGGVATYNLATSTTTSAVFDYTVATGENTTSLAVTAINLNGATVSDVAGNAPDLSLFGLTQVGPQIDTGAFTVSDGENLELPGAFAATITFASDAAGILTLDQSTLFTGTIRGLTDDDTLDLGDISFGAQTTLGYSGDPSGGTLTVGDGINMASIALLGNYLAATFTAASDGLGGTLVVDPSASQAFLAAPLHA